MEKLDPHNSNRLMPMGHTYTKTHSDCSTWTTKVIDNKYRSVKQYAPADGNLTEHVDDAAVWRMILYMQSDHDLVAARLADHHHADQLVRSTGFVSYYGCRGGVHRRHGCRTHGTVTHERTHTHTHTHVCIACVRTILVGKSSASVADG